MKLSIKVEPGIAAPWEAKGVDSFFKKMLMSLEIGYGRMPIVIWCGAFVPIVAEMSRAFKDMPILLTGIGGSKANAHGENESVSLAVMKKAILSEFTFLCFASSHYDGAK